LSLAVSLWCLLSDVLQETRGLIAPLGRPLPCVEARPHLGWVQVDRDAYLPDFIGNSGRCGLSDKCLAASLHVGLALRTTLEIEHDATLNIAAVHAGEDVV